MISGSTIKAKQKSPDCIVRAFVGRQRSFFAAFRTSCSLSLPVFARIVFNVVLGPNPGIGPQAGSGSGNHRVSYVSYHLHPDGDHQVLFASCRTFRKENFSFQSTQGHCRCSA
jgi:hypothetical protein